ncbi:ABC protein, sub ABCG [Blomia tropicalis]|nr:ABC protein, sub ABCG [Blomia tropicalis]
MSTSNRDETLHEAAKLHLHWRNLSYTVGKENKCLINSMSGHLQSGQLTAILGPSGSGKTTLFECLAKRRISGVTGQVWASSSAGQMKRVRIVYSPQKDCLINVLTVRESMLYAAEMQRYCGRNLDIWKTENDEGYDEEDDIDDSDIDQFELRKQHYHNEKHGYLKVEEIIDQLGLTQCADVRVSGCSGGQKKRLSIALELIFSPNVLLLDEPTTGLDSVTSLQLIQLLKSLVQRHPVIICATIHQPSAKLFNQFDHLYLVSRMGTCVYNAPQTELLTYLNGFGLQCPIFHNIADFALEVISGVHGDDVLHQMNEVESKRLMIIDDQEFRVNINSERELSTTMAYDQLNSSWTLMKRSTIISLREPFDFGFRVLGLAMVLGIRFLVNNQLTIIENDCLNSTKFARKMLEIGSNPDNFRITALVSRDIILLISSILFSVIISLTPALFLFPIELAVFNKEHSNQWYSRWSYYVGKSIADLPPTLLFPSIAGAITYLLLEQPDGWWRFFAFMGIVMASAILAHSIGLLISIFCISNTTAAVIVGANVFIPMFVFSGFIIPLHKLPAYVRPFTFLSIYKLAIESILILFYGFDQCDGSQMQLKLEHFADYVPPSFINITTCIHETTSLPSFDYLLDSYNKDIGSISRSIILNRLHINDSDFFINSGLIVLFIVIIRFISYYVLKWKTDPK